MRYARRVVGSLFEAFSHRAAGSTWQPPPRHAWRWLKGLTAAHVARKAFAEAADEADNLVGGTPRADNPVANFLAKGRPEK